MSCASVPTCKRSALVVGLLPPHLVERPRCPLNGLWVGDDQPAVPGEMAIHRDAVWLVLAVFCSEGAPAATKRFIASALAEREPDRDKRGAAEAAPPCDFQIAGWATAAGAGARRVVR